MRVGKSLLMICMGLGFSLVSRAQDDQDLQGRVQYENSEDASARQTRPARTTPVEGEMDMSPSMTRLFENNLSDPEKEVQVVEAFEDKAFIQSLSGKETMPDDFEYKDDKFVLKYKRVGKEEKIKADGDPSEFVAKYNAFKQGGTPANLEAERENMYAEPKEVNSMSESEMDMSSRGVDARTRARNYAPVQTEIMRIGVPAEPSGNCQMKDPTMTPNQGRMKGKHNCPNRSGMKNNGSGSSSMGSPNSSESSGAKVKSKRERYKFKGEDGSEVKVKKDKIKIKGGNDETVN